MTDLISRPLTELCGNCHQEFGQHSMWGNWCHSPNQGKFRPMTAREQDVLQSIKRSGLRVFPSGNRGTTGGT
jgi:hypothetical protein